MSSIKLEPCPFCGDDGDKSFMEMFSPQTGNDWTRVTCRGCGASASLMNWNRRHQPEEEVQSVGDLLKQFKELYPKAMTEFAEQMRSMGITSAPIGNHQASMFKLERAIYEALAAKDTP